MIGTIRKHSQALWGIIIVAVIVSFVIYFSPSNKLERAAGGREMDYGTLYGKKLTRADIATAQNETLLRFFLSAGRRIDPSTPQFTAEYQRRLLMLQNLKRYSIHADDVTVGKHIRAISIFRKEDGSFDEARYKQVIKAELEPNGFTEADFFEYIRHDVGQSYLIQLMGLPGLLSAPRGAESDFVRMTEAVDAEVAFFSRSNFLDSVKSDPATISNYYTLNIARYRIPERKVLSYVFFAATNYLAPAEKVLAADTNLDRRIDQEYFEKGTNSFRDGTNTLTAAEAKAKLKKEHLLDEEKKSAGQAAVEFANKLYRMTPLSLGNLDALAATNGMKVLVTSPFSKDESPREIDSEKVIPQDALALDNQNPFSTPIPGENGTYILAYKKTIPESFPTFKEREKVVTEEFRRTQAQEQMNMAADAFATRLTNGLAQGKTFHDICTDEKITPIPVFAVSHQTKELPAILGRAELGDFIDAALETPVGKASSFHSTRDGGFVVFVKKVIPPSDEQRKEEFPKYMEQYRDQQEGVAFNEWFQHEYMKSGLLERSATKAAKSAK